MRKSSAYEVRCPSCDVSAPPGTRRCMHCGGPMIEAGTVALSSAAPESLQEVILRHERAGGDAIEDEEAAPRSGFSRGIGLLWILMLIAVSVYRQCTAPPG